MTTAKDWDDFSPAEAIIDYFSTQTKCMPKLLMQTIGLYNNPVHSTTAKTLASSPSPHKSMDRVSMIR